MLLLDDIGYLDVSPERTSDFRAQKQIRKPKPPGRHPQQNWTAGPKKHGWKAFLLTQIWRVSLAVNTRPERMTTPSRGLERATRRNAKRRVKRAASRALQSSPHYGQDPWVHVLYSPKLTKLHQAHLPGGLFGFKHDGFPTWDHFLSRSMGLGGP